MRPRFGPLTQVLAVVFLIAGVGAVHAALASGHQVTPGHRGDDGILVALFALFIAVAWGLWIERMWGWWLGLATAVVTCIGDLALDGGGGWIPWVVISALFAVSAVQGKRDEQMASHRQG